MVKDANKKIKDSSLMELISSQSKMIFENNVKVQYPLYQASE